MTVQFRSSSILSFSAMYVGIANNENFLLMTVLANESTLLKARSFQLVIFDCDGVLVDSERICNQVFSEMLNELGLPVTLSDMFDRFVGHSMAYCMQIVTEMLGNAPPPDFVERLRERTQVALEANLVPVPGIVAALDQIRLPTCVASNGSHEKMQMTLGLTGLLQRFDGRLFSATDVAKGKPAPDVYLHAAAVNGVSPSACLVIDDTPTGVTAAVAAGMTVHGYAALTPAKALLDAGADRVFMSMDELPAMIASGRSSRS